MRAALIIVLFVFSAVVLRAREAQPGSDVWLTNAPALPEPFHTAAIDTNRFSNLKMEAVAGKLLVRWETREPFAEARLAASADAPGHWPARDWRTFPMRRSGMGWVTEVPADSLDVPLIYFVIAGSGTASPMRIAHPGGLGLEVPTRLFWPFLEGFEQQLESWRIIGEPGLERSTQAKNGRASLLVRIPRNRRSVTLVTTRLRGWFLQEHDATGVTLWLRTKTGRGTARFSLFANAFSTNQIIARRQEAIGVTDKWTRALLPFSSFPRLQLGDVDLFSIEVTGAPGTEFLLDDVQLLGRWPEDY